MTTQTQGNPDAVVIGAGPAGLAVARELDHQHGIKALVLDRAAAPAISWRTRYDNFRLNTTGFLSHLPGQRIPLNAGRWPTKEDMVRYFDHYVQRQNIALKLGCEVHRVDRAGGVWQLDTSSGVIRTAAIVLATGNYSAPTIPAWPGLSRFNGEIVHSANFTNAWPYRGRDVLVVGAGNSAADIAVQLANDGARRIWLAVRTPPHLVRRAMGPFPSDIFLELSARVPARMIDPLIARMTRLMWGDLSAYGFQRPPLGLKATVETRGRIPTLADELIDAVRIGRVEVVGAVKAIESDGVILADGTSVAPQVIIAATGFEHESRRFGRTSRRPRRARQPVRRLCLARRRRNVRDRIRHSAQWSTAGDPHQRDAIGPGSRGLSSADWSIGSSSERSRDDLSLAMPAGTASVKSKGIQ